MPSWSTPPHRPNRAGFWQDSFYNLDVSGLPTLSDSNAIIAATRSHHAANSSPWIKVYTFGQAKWDSGASAHYFIDTLPGDPNSSRVNWNVNLFYAPEASSPNPQIYFSDLRQEGATRDFFGNYTHTFWDGNDRHAILWSESSDELLEAIGYSGFSPDAIAACTWDLSSYTLPANRGVVAARIPIAPFFFTYQDLLDCGSTGELGHMLGVVLHDYKNGVVWPARRGDGTLSSGARAGDVFRLKSSFNLNSLPNNAWRALARTMQKRGIMVYDKSHVHALLATPNDPAWPSSFNSDGPFDFNHFEMVDLSSVAGATNSILIGDEPPPGPSGPSGPTGASGPTGPSGAPTGPVDPPDVEVPSGPTGIPTAGFSGPQGSAFTGVTYTPIGFTGSTAEFPTFPSAGRKGWVLYDPTLPVSESEPKNPYTLPTNPHSDSGSFSINKTATYQVQGAAFYRDSTGTLRDDSTLIHTRPNELSTFTFEGNFYTIDELTTLNNWVSKNHQVLLRDDLGRVFYIYFTGLKLARVRSRNRMKHSYTLTGFVLAEIQE